MKTRMEDTDVYRRSVEISDDVWFRVIRWSTFAQDTVGKQLVKSVDSIAANLVEGEGRGGGNDSVRFFLYSRASAREGRHWLRRAVARNLIEAAEGERLIGQLSEVVGMIHSLVRYRRQSPGVVREERAVYGDAACDLFVNNMEDFLPLTSTP